MQQHFYNNISLIRKYRWTAWFYDILDYPWERRYRLWRPQLLADLHGAVLEAGVGTGRNLKYYPEHIQLTGIELSPNMLKIAKRRARKAKCSVELYQDDATQLHTLPNSHYDWLISTFLCCVMPDNQQQIALQQFARVLKPGGQFRLLEIVYSQDPVLRKRQKLFSRFVEKVYGARFDRQTLTYLKNSPELNVINTTFLKDDTYLLIEGIKH